LLKNHGEFLKKIWREISRGFSNYWRTLKIFSKNIYKIDIFFILYSLLEFYTFLKQKKQKKDEKLIQIFDHEKYIFKKMFLISICIY